MPIPTHSNSCYTKTFPWNCPDCKEKVYYLSCTCGSKVFFNSLGDPWPEHKCRKYKIRRAIEMVQDIKHLTSDEVFKIIEDSGDVIPDEYVEFIDKLLANRKIEPKLIHIEFDPRIDQIMGKVMGINSNINFYRKFNVKQSDIAKQMLKELSIEPFSEITLRANSNETGIINEYKVYLTNKIIKNNTIQQNQFIALQLRPSNSIYKCWIGNPVKGFNTN